jgi:hypothetical protein
MNLITEKLHRVYLAIALVLVIPDTFYWYSLNDYTSYQTAFNAITSSTGLTWLLVSYLALFFAIFAQKLEMRAFLTVVAVVTRVFFLVWITDIWRSNEVSIPTLLKNVFIQTNNAPYIELFALIAMVPLVLSLIIQKTRVANFLTALINFLRQPENKNHRIGFQVVAYKYKMEFPKWKLWYHDPEVKDYSLSSYIMVADFTNAQQFWTVVDKVLSKLYPLNIVVTPEFIVNVPTGAFDVAPPPFK